MKYSTVAVFCILPFVLGCWPEDDPPAPPSGGGSSSGGSSANGGGEPVPGSSGQDPTTPEGPFGRFEGEVVTAWSADGRKMTLREDFAYIDPDGKRWDAPAGSVVDGASIPRAFWTVIGGPFEGPYRNASVVHDVACVMKTEPWEDVHRAFYHACRCGGVGQSKAKLMYWGVHHFGPRWKLVEGPRVMYSLAPNAESAPVRTAEPIAVAVEPLPAPDEELVRKVEALIASENLSLEDLENLKLE